MVTSDLHGSHEFRDYLARRMEFVGQAAEGVPGWLEPMDVDEIWSFGLGEENRGRDEFVDHLSMSEDIKISLSYESCSAGRLYLVP